jgi:hypothetical protein
MKLLKSIRWRSPCRGIVTRLSWKRPISTSCRSLQERENQSPDITDSPVPKLTIASRRQKPWTPNEIKTVIKGYKKGETARQVLTSEGIRHYTRTFQPSCTEMQDVECLRLEGHSWAQITKSMFPDRSARQISKTFMRAFGRRIGRGRTAKTFIPSVEELADVERLRSAGSTWVEIRTSKYPDKQVRQVCDSFSGKGFRLGSVDLAEIQRLREAQNTWQQITDSKYPGKTPRQVRLAFVRQFNDRSKSRRIGFKIPSADIAKIQHLREANESWRAIVDLMYPATGPATVRRDFLRQTDGRSGTYRTPTTDKPPDRSATRISCGSACRDRAGRKRTFDISSADMLDVQRLRSEGKSWAQIKDMKYPDRSGELVRAAFIRQDDSRSEEELRKNGKPLFPILRIPPAEAADVQRLLEAKKTWNEIITLKYPGRKWSTVRSSWLRQMKIQQDAGIIKHVYRNKQGKRPLELSPVEIQDIKHWRMAKQTWKEIVMLRLRNENYQRVRKAFICHMGGLRPKHKSRSLPALEGQVAS